MAETIIDSGTLTEFFTGQRPEAERERRYRLLLGAAAALDSLDEPDVLLERFGDLLVKLFAPSCCILEVAGNSWTHPLAGDGQAPPGISKAVMARIRERTEAQLLSRVPREAELQASRSVASLGIQSAMGTPVLVGGEPIGLVYVDRRHPSAPPFEEEDLLLMIFIARLVSSAVIGSNRFAKLDAEVRLLRSSRPAAGTLVGESQATAKLRAVIADKIGPTRSNVLLVGETGTGKNVVARALHLASPRRKGPFVGVNCAAIPRELLESELFGHEKGAFSGADRRKTGQFEVASGGTLFLDEVGELDAAAQAKLLTVLEERKLTRVGGTRPVAIDVRIVAATNRNLDREVEAGTFRDDLYYRLNVIRLEIPPLRERPEDIAPLAEHFLGLACHEVGRRVPGIAATAMALIEQHPWPGNVRELSNCIERAVVFADEGTELQPDHLPDEIREGRQTAAPARGSDEERRLIEDALERTKGNKREAARLLGWYPQKLYDRLKRHGIGDDWS